jgi:hypothetical protein
MSFLQDEAETTGNLDGSELDTQDTESSCSNNPEASEHEEVESISIHISGIIYYKEANS